METEMETERRKRLDLETMELNTSFDTVENGALTYFKNGIFSKYGLIVEGSKIKC